jgi:thymidylate synthase (FAD)
MSKRTIHDGIGSVELLETFGNDLTVVNAARVSFAKESNTLTEADKKLIRYLARNNHNSPFFHPQIRFRIKMPIFVAREWYRHTIGLARNEVSRRYVDTPPECWMPETLRSRDPKLKQGSKTESIPDEAAVMARYDAMQRQSLDFYAELLTLNVAPEVARGVLPQSMYTEFIETGSLAAYARICQLRLDPHAQKEIRDYAGIVADLMVAAFPVSWAALMETVPAQPVPANAAPTISLPAPAPVENTIAPTADYTSWGC